MDQVLSARENRDAIFLVVDLVSLPSGVVLQQEGRFWEKQFLLQLCLRHSAPLPRQRTLNQAVEEQEARFSSHLRVEHRGGFRHGVLAAKHRFLIPCYRQLGQLLLSKCRMVGLLNRHLCQNLILQGHYKIQAWFENKVWWEPIRSHGKVFQRGLRRSEWSNRSTLLAGALRGILKNHRRYTPNPSK